MNESNKMTENLKKLQKELIHSKYLDSQTKTLINQTNIVDTQSHSEKITQKQLKLAIKKTNIDINITTFVTMDHKETATHILNIMKVFKSVNKNLEKELEQEDNSSCI